MTVSADTSRDASVFSPVLERLAGDLPAHFGPGALRLEYLAVEERPFSHLARLAVYGERDPRPVATLFAKIFKPRPIDGGLDAMRRRVVHDFDTTARVRAWLEPHAELDTVPPVACYPEHLAIVTREVAAPTLLDHIVSRVSWYPTEQRLREVERTLATVGRWIRVFQSLDVTGRRVDLASLQDYVDVRLQRLVAHPPARFARGDRMRTLEHFDELAAAIAPGELAEVLVHADLAPGNVLVDGQRIVVLDFAMTRRGSRLHDLTRLYLQLGLLTIKPQISVRVVSRLQQALVAGFDPSLTPDRPLFRLLLLLHRINHLTTLSLATPSWTEAIYNRAVRWQHRQWLTGELGRDVAAACA